MDPAAAPTTKEEEMAMDVGSPSRESAASVLDTITQRLIGKSGEIFNATTEFRSTLIGIQPTPDCPPTCKQQESPVGGYMGDHTRQLSIVEGKLDDILENIRVTMSEFPRQEKTTQQVTVKR